MSYDAAVPANMYLKSSYDQSIWHRLSKPLMPPKNSGCMSPPPIAASKWKPGASGDRIWVCGITPSESHLLPLGVKKNRHSTNMRLRVRSSKFSGWKEIKGLTVIRRTFPHKESNYVLLSSVIFTFISSHLNDSSAAKFVLLR